MIIYGKNPVFEAILTNKKINKIFIGSENFNLKEEIINLTHDKVSIEIIKKNALDKLTDFAVHQNIAADIVNNFFVDFNVELKKLKCKTNCVVLILDGITDPCNFGAILRTYAAGGCSFVIIRRNRACPISASVIKSSSGAIFHIKLVEVTNINNAIEILKSEGFWILGTDALSKTNIYSLDISGKISIVVGSEGKGISKLTKEKCDYLTKIPMTNNIESLNVSVASAIVFYEILRKNNLFN